MVPSTPRNNICLLDIFSVPKYCWCRLHRNFTCWRCAVWCRYDSWIIVIYNLLTTTTLSLVVLFHFWRNIPILLLRPRFHTFPYFTTFTLIYAPVHHLTHLFLLSPSVSCEYVQLTRPINLCIYSYLSLYN